MTLTAETLLAVARDHLIDRDDPEGFQRRLRGLCAALEPLRANLAATGRESDQKGLLEAAGAMVVAQLAIQQAADLLHGVGELVVETLEAP